MIQNIKWIKYPQYPFMKKVVLLFLSTSKISVLIKSNYLHSIDATGNVQTTSHLKTASATKADEGYTPLFHCGPTSFYHKRSEIAHATWCEEWQIWHHMLLPVEEVPFFCTLNLDSICLQKKRFLMIFHAREFPRNIQRVCPSFESITFFPNGPTFVCMCLKISCDVQFLGQYYGTRIAHWHSWLIDLSLHS